MVNVFRPVIGDVLSPARVLQGKNYKNFSFGINATIEEYQVRGLYLEVGGKPVITKYQNLYLKSEKIDHPTQTVVLEWETTDKGQEQIAEIDRIEGIETAQEDGDLKSISVEDANAWVTAKLMEAYGSVEVVTNVASAKTAMTKILLAVQEINHKEIPYLLG